MFIPPFCPRATCSNHDTAHGRWWSHRGSYHTRVSGSVPRFMCTACRKTFSVQTFSVHYYVKRIFDLAEVERLSSSSMSLRALGRHLACTCASVQNRIDRLARQGVALHQHLRTLADRREDVCFDGLVSFDRSQYFPNDIGISITSRSRFILGLTHATTRRGGRMREDQKEKRERLYEGLVFERKAIERSFRAHLDRLARERPPGPRCPLIMITDEKREYGRAFTRHRLFREQDGDHRAVHRTVNSRVPRTFRNPLFASNYIDREIRKDRADQRRETACFARDAANMMSRLAVYAVHHNYVKQYSSRERKAQRGTHAEEAGIRRAAVERARGAFFGVRAFLSHLRLDEMDAAIWKKRVYSPETGRVEEARLPGFALA